MMDQATRNKIVSFSRRIKANLGSRSHLTSDGRTRSADAKRSEGPAMAMITPERDLEESFVSKLRDLKYE